MKPRKLKIRGLNSFIEEQEIDFERLTNKGLFGIFGPTGSGKSTILDAMTIALYGSISRDTKEFMNSLCSSLSVSYEFEIGVGSERKVYIADRLINKDKNGSYKLKTSRLREIQGDIDLPIAEGSNEVKSTVEKIIGLTAEDFTRSVVLPQGRFSEFLRLTGKDRRNMLERIFRLERFGRNLGDRIRYIKREKTDSLNVLLGSIRNYEEKGISEERYSILKKELELLHQEEAELKREKAELLKSYEKYKVIWELQQELEVYKGKEEELQSRAGDIENKRTALSKYRNGSLLKPLLEELQVLNERLQQNETELRQNYDSLESLKKELVLSEVEYRNWALKKEVEVPELIAREASLRRALDIEEAIKEQEKAREALLQLFSVEKAKKQKLDKEFEEINKGRGEALNQRSSIENRLEAIHIDPDYRDRVQKAAALEEEYFKSIKEKEELVKRCSQRRGAVEDLKKQLEEILKHQDQCYKEVAVTENQMERLQQNQPGDNKVLLELKDIINESDAIMREYNTNEKRASEVKENRDKLLAEKNLFEGRIRDIEASVNEKKEKLNALKEEIRALEKNNMAAALAKELHKGDNCPVCGSDHHPHIAERIEDKALLEKEDLKLKMEAEINNDDKVLRELEGRLQALISSEEYISRELKSLLEKLSGIDIENIRERRVKTERDFQELSLNLEEWNKNKELTEKNLNRFKEQKGLIDKNEVKLSENLKAEVRALEELEASLKLLEERCNGLEEEYLKVKSELQLEDIKGKVVELKELEKENIELRRKHKGLGERITAGERKLEECSGMLKEIEVEIARITESGKERRSVIDRDRAELNKLTEGRQPQEYLNEVLQAKNYIIKQEEAFRNKVEKDKEERQKLSDKLLSCEGNKANLTNQKSELEIKLHRGLKEFGFDGVNSLTASLMTQEAAKSLEQELEQYDNNVKIVRANLEQLRNKLSNDSIEKEAWVELQEKREDNGRALELKIREIAAKEQILQEMERELAQLKTLNDNRRQLEHICSNLEDISKLVEGNKFVEFVAMHQLRYIALEASKRLKDITRGRYALEIDSTGNFIMRDDFNGGSRRSTSTLSGGETFLTSLCLALSLSSQIQLKGSAPLEFFFLDEGFGTLDTDLLEIVISSLERLHSDKLCVGIISHVEELKNRVPIKLIVDPAEQSVSGSRVRIELS
jgi:DNA repair protein SbcC/Rad50